MRNGPLVPLLRPTSWAVSYEEWRDEAACTGLPVEQFELTDSLSKGVQHEPIAQGLKVCASCPVRQECGVNSSELDRYWTTRGGQPPEGLFPDAERPDYQSVRAGRTGFAPGEGPARTPQVTCKRDHDDWMIDGRGKRRCRTCQKRKNTGS